MAVRIATTERIFPAEGDARLGRGIAGGGVRRDRGPEQERDGDQRREPDEDPHRPRPVLADAPHLVERGIEHPDQRDRGDDQRDEADPAGHARRRRR